MISNRRYWLLLALVLLVHIAGMFVTLFENDSAQFAVMAMRMVQEGDFLNLIKGTEDYLDKPHMHYWLAALSFKIFGIHDWAYRIPALLATLLGGYACYGLGKLLYRPQVGKLSALIFLSAQTIVLSVIDVRTDAVLTGFTILAIWQLAAYVRSRSLTHLAIGALAAGLAFSTKGQIAVLVIGLPLLCDLVYTGNWKTLVNWRSLVGILVFGLSITPILYAYYHQFDLHPEKVIRGQGDRSGIFFILWEQSFERLSGEGVGRNSSDYFFFFHTFLWVFLPWTVIGLAAYVERAKTFLKLRFRYHANYEFLTLGGITMIFIIISFAQFKLPHYLNIVIPLFSILTASYLYQLYLHTKAKTLKGLLIVQYAVLSIVFIASALICYYVFKFENPVNYAWKFALAILTIYYCLKHEAYYLRVITVSALASILLNAIMNMHFYPELLKYQAGSTMAGDIKLRQIPPDSIYKLSDDYTWALDFYLQRPIPITTLAQLESDDDIWLYATDDQLREMQRQGLEWDEKISVDQFRITRLQLRFLNPTSREKVLEKRHLIHLVRRGLP